MDKYRVINRSLTLAALLALLDDSGVVDGNDAYIQASVNLTEAAGTIAAGRAAVILT